MGDIHPTPAPGCPPQNGIGTGEVSSTRGRESHPVETTSILGASVRPTNAGEATAGRDNNIDFLRFMLATWVLYAHCGPLLFGSDEFSPRGHYQHVAGNLPVAFFFVLSGFLITRSWEQSRGWRDYLRRRVLRIYPGYIVAAIFCAIVVGPLGADDAAMYFHRLSIWQFLAGSARFNLHAALPPVFTHLPWPDELNGSLWTIGWEFLCYLLVAALGLAALLRDGRWPLALFVFACLTIGARNLSTHHLIHFSTPPAASAITPSGGPPETAAASVSAAHPGLKSLLHTFWDQVIVDSHWPPYITMFLAGMCFYLFRQSIPWSRGWFLVSLAMMIAAGWFNLLELALPVFGTYTAFYFAYSQTLQLHHWGKHGDFSYGVYMYAYPLQQLAVMYLGSRLTVPGLFALVFPATLLLAYLSWNFVERPFMQRKKRLATESKPVVALAT